MKLLSPKAYELKEMAIFEVMSSLYWVVFREVDYYGLEELEARYFAKKLDLELGL